MHQELIDRLMSFARHHNLQFDYGFDEKYSVYQFKFQNYDHTWVYTQEVSQEQLDLFNGPNEYFADGIIHNLVTNYHIV